MGKIPLFLCYIFLFSVSCVDQYSPAEIKSDAAILVIDGYINGAPGSLTSITLSHTQVLSATKTTAELRANVRVEGEDANAFVLQEKGNGVYSSSLNLNQQTRYRLRIKTTSGKEYVSDYVEIKQTPVIDHIDWEVDKSKNGLQIYVSTHASKEASRFYYWDFVETWEYRADCNNPLDKISTYTCWRSDVAHTILLSSTERTSDNVVDQFPVTFLDANSAKPYVIYSILVRQYAVTKEAFEYLDGLKKSTEQLGSIFDSQPTSLTGNFHSVNNPDEPVIGYLRAHTVAEKRIFIENSKLPVWFYKIPNWLACPPSDDGCPSPPPTACSDCRVGGGVIVKPDFWIY